jgi:Tol biopolymer transport system component
MKADGTNRRRVTHEAYSCAYPPRFVGTKIWYCVGLGGANQDIFEINPDGTGRRQLSTMSGQHAAFEVYGSKVYFGREVGGNSNTNEIYSANLDFTGAVQLTSGSLYTFLWDLAPDGSKILKSRHEVYGTGPDNLYSMNLDGTGETKLTTYTLTSNYCGYARYSPDGTKILYMLSDGTQNDIWMMNTDGSGVTRVTNTPTKSECPTDWR